MCIRDRLPQLRRVAPEEYVSLRAMPVLEADTWRQALVGEYFYACQDATFGAPTSAAPATRNE